MSHDSDRALDVIGKRLKLLDEINKKGTTVIVATHAKDIVDDMQKRVIAIENGSIVRDEEKGVYGYEN